MFDTKTAGDTIPTKYSTSHGQYLLEVEKMWHVPWSYALRWLVLFLELRKF